MLFWGRFNLQGENCHSIYYIHVYVYISSYQSIFPSGVCICLLHVCYTDIIFICLTFHFPSIEHSYLAFIPFFKTIPNAKDLGYLALLNPPFLIGLLNFIWENLPGSPYCIRQLTVDSWLQGGDLTYKGGRYCIIPINTDEYNTSSLGTWLKDL